MIMMVMIMVIDFCTAESLGMCTKEWRSLNHWNHPQSMFVLQDPCMDTGPLLSKRRGARRIHPTPLEKIGFHLLVPLASPFSKNPEARRHTAAQHVSKRLLPTLKSLLWQIPAVMQPISFPSVLEARINQMRNLKRGARDMPYAPVRKGRVNSRVSPISQSKSGTACWSVYKRLAHTQNIGVIAQAWNLGAVAKWHLRSGCESNRMVKQHLASQDSAGLGRLHLGMQFE